MEVIGIMNVLTEKKAWSNEKSLAWLERARKATTFGQSNLRGALKLMDKPLFIARAKGSRVSDVDGNEYVDFSNSAGASILGHNHPRYIQALKDQLSSFYTSTSGLNQSTMEVELAEKIVNHVPCAEKVRFCVTGTDAVQLAIRLARAYTNRRYFIRFEGHYHGWLDNVLGGVPNSDPKGKPFAIDSEEDLLSTAGRDAEAFKQSFLLPWNDIGELERFLAKHGEEIALIIMEPILVNGECCSPRPGYLEKVRELCNKYGILLCFDEVITGFRMGLGGAQGALGVTPDLATLGKAFGAGIPVSAVAGKAEIMNQLDEGKVIGAGTFNGYPLGMVAALATIKILEENNGAIYNKIDRVQKKLTKGLQEISRRRGIPLLIQEARGVFFTLFTDKDIAYSVRDLHDLDWEKHAKFFYKLVEEGVLLMFIGRWYISGAIEEEDVNMGLEGADQVLATL